MLSINQRCLQWRTFISSNNITTFRIKHSQRKPECDLQAFYLTPQTGTGGLPQVDAHQAEPGECGANGSSAVYENDNTAYDTITDIDTVSVYEGLDKANVYLNTAHIYSDLK